MKKGFKNKIPLKITLLYALLGGAWILSSDQFLKSLGLDRHLLTWAQTEKGWAYVLVTSFFLYGMINQSVRSLKASEEKLSKSYSQLEKVYKELGATHEELLAAEEELRQQFEELRERENYYRGIYEGVSSGIMVLSENGSLIHANDSAKQVFDYKTGLKYSVQEKELSWEELVQKFVQGTDQEKNLFIKVVEKNGHKHWLWVNRDSIENTETHEKNTVLTFVDQTEEKRTEMITSILNEIDKMVLAGTSFKSISEILCQRMVEKLDFIFAWVGSKEDDGRVVVQASAGIEALSSLDVRWDESEYAQGAAGRAIRQGKPQTLSVEGNPTYKAWSGFEGSGICSATAFPLLHEETVLGVFVLYSDLPDYFNSKRIQVYSHFSYQLAHAFALIKERERLERFQILADHVNDALFFVSTEGRIIDVNEPAERMYGYTREELLNIDIRTFGFSKEELKREYLSKKDEYQWESVHFTKEGRAFPVEISSMSANLKGQPILLGVIRDISERKKAEEAIWHKAHYDALTELPNRLYFTKLLDNALNQAKAKQHKCAVLFLDLDQFKLINDTMGHNIGDQLLQLVAKRMEGLNLEGTLGRLGGDEFVILLAELKQTEEAALAAEKIIQAFVSPFQIEENEVYITPSIGISIFPNDGEDRETLLKQADTAMYYAKEQGRNNYRFFTSMLNARIQEKAALGNLLRKALEQKEFCLYYQPQVDIHTGRIKGMEALIRWNSPIKGEVSPGVFIPIAEENGLIVPIGAWVLRSACVQNFKWQKMGYPFLPISVNISARQFREPMFIESIAEVLEETGLTPEWLEIEITESIAMENIENSRKQLNRLKELGVTVAIDDFGTGYSSLKYLRKLSIDTLKIDQSFVQDIGKNENGEAIVIAIIQLAQNLNMKVIAEGVETEAQMSFLKYKGCDEMQGYYYCKPLPAGQIEDFLKKEKVSFA